MKKFVCILLAFSTLSISAKGQGNVPKRLTYGVEWGYIATFHSGFHYNFFAEEGFRVDEYDNRLTYHSNAEVYVHFGYNFSPQTNLSMYIGYEGITDIHQAIPISLRLTRYFKENGKGDRWLTYLDLGSGIGIKQPVQEILTGKIGGGYRLALSKTTALDFLLALRMTYTHPQIQYINETIPAHNINRNNACVSALSFSLALSF